MPVSTPPSLTSIKAEFGGPNNLTPYYRNGAYVPTNSYNNAIATNSNQLKISQFAGARKDIPVTLTNVYRFIEHALPGSEQQAYYEVNPNGYWVCGTNAQLYSTGWFSNPTNLSPGLLQIKGTNIPNWIDFNTIISKLVTKNNQTAKVKGLWTIRLKSNNSVQCTVDLSANCYNNFIP